MEARCFGGAASGSSCRPPRAPTTRRARHRMRPAAAARPRARAPHLPRAEQRRRAAEQREQPQIDRGMHRAPVGHGARRERVPSPVCERLDGGAHVAQRGVARAGGAAAGVRRRGGVGCQDAPEGVVLGGEALLLGVQPAGRERRQARCAARPRAAAGSGARGGGRRAASEQPARRRETGARYRGCAGGRCTAAADQARQNQAQVLLRRVLLRVERLLLQGLRLRSRRPVPRLRRPSSPAHWIIIRRRIRRTVLKT